MNSNLSIEEIVLINNLLYAENLGGPKGTFLSPGQETRTIGDYINRVVKNFDKIEDNREYSTGITGAEYKEILLAVRKKQHLSDMIIMQVHIESQDAGGGRSALLYDPANNEAIVAFKGTEGDAEWIDNLSGLCRVPTPYQQSALDWFQSLDLSGYDIITVTGHSKGGNKSKFITLMDERVDNCFPMDGQGFNDDFVKRYSDNIREYGDKILNINAESDFVNILLNDVGKRTFYLGTNFGRLGFVENHCSNAVLFFDDEGDASIWQAAGQDQRMVDLDHMLNSFIRSYPAGKKEALYNALGNVIVCAKNNDKEGILTTLTGDQYKDNTADLLAFILRYKEEKPQIIASLREILSQNGFDTRMLGVIDFITNHELIMEFIGASPNSIIALLRLKNAPKELITFLQNHHELFDFLILTASKMRSLDPTKYRGDDMTPDTAGGWFSSFGKKTSRKKTALLLAIILLLLLFFIFLFLVH